ncbi:MAG TPA: endonuclease/exonuclease/phosphatase family protein [Xanthomonadaceae bacterium]|nr:endonuclease/exonuclease/phosphatase family protein [Xanthomonadaceae bacterium]
MNAPFEGVAPAVDANVRLRLLSYNIQAGARVSRYRHYVTHGWKQLLPHREKHRNLELVARAISDFDIVGLQEADTGSLRSGFLNQTQFLAEAAGFPYWSQQTNRDVARLASSGNGLISRFEPTEVLDHRLPGRIRGRGALIARFGHDDDALLVINAHLSLGPQARMRQIEFLCELAEEYRHVVLMGDFNTRVDSPELRRLFQRGHLRPPEISPRSYPSWRPQRAIDHILVTDSLKVVEGGVLPLAVSDHLPVSLEVQLPANCRIASQSA